MNHCNKKSHSNAWTARRLGMALAVAAALGARAPAARAEPPSREVRAAAVALFDEGRALMSAGNYAEACPKLAESQRLDPGIGTLFNLADCHEHIGKTASAWLGFRDVAAAALAAGQGEREKVARARAAALEPKLSRLRIVVPREAAAEGLSIERDGAPVGQALWGTPVPLDPGVHEVVATAPGKRAFRASVELKQPGTVSVELPPLAPDASAPPAPPPSAAKPPPPAAPPMAPAAPDAAEPSSGGAWQAPVGVVAMGLGLAGLGAGTVLGVVAKSKFDDAEAQGHCNADNRCDDVGLGQRDDAVTLGNAGTVVFIAGAVFAAGGAVLWLTASSGDGAAPPSARAAPALRVGAAPGALVIRGAF